LAAQTGSAAVTIGGSLATEPETVDKCTNAESGRGCLAVFRFANDPAAVLVAPFDGVIVRWRARFGPNTEAQTIRIRVVQDLPPYEYKIISSGPLKSIPAGPGTYTFAASLPIATGELVGLEGESGKGIDDRGQSQVPGGATWIYNPPGMALDGSTTGYPTSAGIGTEATFNVEVEPDCDHDGLADESQDLSLPPACKPPPPPVAAPSNAFTLGKPRLNKKKGTAKEPVTVPGPGEITLTGKGVKGSSLAAGTAGTVNLPVKPNGKKKRKLNSVGSVKVKVAVTFTPTGGVANSQNRKVTLKKRLH
jgi:hypothetical protein